MVNLKRLSQRKQTLYFILEALRKPFYKLYLKRRKVSYGNFGNKKSRQQCHN